MKKIKDININTKVYWNNIYGTNDKRKEYAAQGTSDSAIRDETGRVWAAIPTKRFIRAMEEVKDGDKVVDMGCGVGVFTRLIKDTMPNCEVWGTDISDKAIADNMAENPNINYIHQYVGAQDDLPSEYFDVVFSGEVLEHLDDPAHLFGDARRVLKKGGKFILTTPRGSSIQSEEHVWEFSPSDINDLYVSHGFNKPRFIPLPDMEHLVVIFAVGKKI